jgi:hypothetical protein
MMYLTSDEARVTGQPEFPQGASEPDAADHPVAPGGSDSQAVASSSAPAKIRNYPAGTQKQYERPEIMKKLDCGCAGGKITLDPHVHRFCASHEHKAKQLPILVGIFTQKSSNKSFGLERTWQDALKECHFWLWTKHIRLCHKATTLQVPGVIPDEVLQGLLPHILALPVKVDYSRKKKLAKGSADSQPKV